MNAVLVMAALVSCYVGSNTGSPDRQALHVLSCDTESGAAKVVQQVKGLQGTTYFQVSSDGRFLYSIVGDERDKSLPGTAVRFPIAADGTLGAVEPLAELPCPAPCHVSLSPDGAYFAFANYSAGVAGTVLLRGSNGGGAVASAVLPDEGVGPNAKRQKKAYAHFTFWLDGRFGVVNLGCDRIHFFDPQTMVEDPARRICADPGDGPRHAVLSKDGRFLFVVNELSSTVTSFALANGRAVKVDKADMLPVDVTPRTPDGASPDSKAAAIKLTADGTILMASNRGHDSIAFFAVDPVTGRLSRRNVAKLRGKFPRDFELMPGERFMVVGHKLSDEIQVYRFDRTACALEPVGEPIPCWRPLCFKFPRMENGESR